jgi:hypothetical protein
MSHLLTGFCSVSGSGSSVGLVSEVGFLSGVVCRLCLFVVVVVSGPVFGLVSIVGPVSSPAFAWDPESLTGLLSVAEPCQG